MNKIKFIHTADIHFGIENYGHIDSKIGLHSRLLDFKKSFEFIVNFAIKEQVDCFIFAGDAYKNSHPTPTHQRILLETLTPLLDNKIPLIIVVGNHDQSGNVAKAHALDVFNHFKNEVCYIFSKPGKVVLNTKNGILQIVAIPWPNRSIINNFDLNFKSDISKAAEDILKNTIFSFASSLDKTKASILTGHFTVSSGKFSGSERSILVGRDPVLSVSDLAIEPFNYVALGHLHKHQNLSKNEKCPVVYSGSPERIDFGEMDDEKGFCFVEIEKNEFSSKTNYKFVKTPTRPFLEITLKCNSFKTIEEDFLNCIKDLNIENAVVKIFYILSPDVTIIPSSKIFYKILEKAWYVADIKCLNPPRMPRDSLIKIKKEDDDICNLVKNYCLKIGEEKNIEKYVEIIKNYEEINL